MLIDEPFAALDAHVRDALHLELQHLWAETGKTIVFVMHNVREAVCLGDRVFVMTYSPGRMEKEFMIRLPRPRIIEDEKLIGVARAVLSGLKTGTERAFREEFEHGAN